LELHRDSIVAAPACKPIAGVMKFGLASGALRIACPLLKESLPRLGLISTGSSFGVRQSRPTPPVHVRSRFLSDFDGLIDLDAEHVPCHPLQSHPLAGDNGSRGAWQYGKLVGEN
jgi:hypothetical protein